MKIVKSKHIGCYGIIKKENKVLLIKKARGAYKGKLDLPGGGIEYGETPEETLKRELKEETGITSFSYVLKKVITYYEIWDMEENIKEDLSHYAIIYDISLKGNESIKSIPDGLDSLGASWYDIDTLQEKDLSPLAKVIKE